jgi:uncharacterized protein (DUF4415 family)
MRKSGNIVRYTAEELDALPDLTDWDRVNAMTDEEIEANAASEEDADWDVAAVFAGTYQEFLAHRKQQVTLRIDGDILDAFKADGPGYQTRINAVLRAFLQERDRKKAS